MWYRSWGQVILGTAGAINEAFDKYQDKEDERELRKAALKKLKDK